MKNFRVLTMCIVAVIIWAGIASASSLTMKRNAEPDMFRYVALVCNTDPTCVPLLPFPALDILHPATGDPIIVIPPTASGRICYLAEDLVGNRSTGCSNIVPFRGTPLNAPSGNRLIP